MNPVLDAGARGRVFDLARKLTFDGVELVVGRADLAADGLRRLVREKTTSGLEVPSLVLGEHSDLGGIADADPAVAARARRRRRARDRVGSGARGRCAPRPLLRPRGAPRLDRRRTRSGRFPPGVLPGIRRRRRALLRGHAACGRDPRTRRRNRLARVRVLPRRCERGRARHGQRHGDSRARAAHPPRALQGRAGHRRRLSARPRLGGLRRDRQGAGRDRLRRLDRARDSTRPWPSSSRATSRSRARSCRASHRRCGRSSGSSRTTSVAANGTA